MRQERMIQASLFDIFSTHEIGRRSRNGSISIVHCYAWSATICAATGCARPAGVACRRKPCCAARC